MSHDTQQERDARIEVARLFARLLLFELDEENRAALLEPELASALGEVGLDVAPLREASLDQLAGEYLEFFLQPTSGGPLVQSLWVSGTYEGDVTVTVRKLAEAGGFQLDREVARGAPPDHLGCLLLLWARASLDDPRVSQRIEEEHLEWAVAPLERLAEGEGFYAGFSRALRGFLVELTS